MIEDILCTSIFLNDFSSHNKKKPPQGVSVTVTPMMKARVSDTGDRRPVAKPLYSIPKNGVRKLMIMQARCTIEPETCSFRADAS